MLQEVIDAYILMHAGKRKDSEDYQEGKVKFKLQVEMDNDMQEEIEVGKPNQAQIDAEFARLASMRVHPGAVSSVMKVPDNVQAAMAQFKDVPLTEGWVRA
jgi:hypothetical protein